MPVKGVMMAAYRTIHDAAACSDVLRVHSPSKSLSNASGSNAAVKFTSIGWSSCGERGGVRAGSLNPVLVCGCGDCVPFVATNGTQSPQPQTNTGFRLPALTPPRSPQELHPILVNFTAALLPLALLSDLLGLWTRRTSLHAAASWMVLYAAIITPLTGIAGWWWKSRSGGTLPANLITVHQWLGTSLVLLFVVLAVWRWRIHKRNQVPSIAYLLFAGITVLALIYQGSLGGAMAFGR